MADPAHDRDYWRALYAVAHDLASSLEPSEVLARLAKRTTEALAARACTLRLLAEDGQVLQASASFGLSDGYLRKGVVDVAHSPADRDALLGHRVSLQDVRVDPRFQYPEQAAREGLVSMLCVPLIARGRPIGVLRVYTAEQRTFHDEDVEFLEAIAALGALAIDNARLYDELHHDMATALGAIWGDEEEPASA